MGKYKSKKRYMISRAFLPTAASVIKPNIFSNRIRLLANHL